MKKTIYLIVIALVLPASSYDNVQTHEASAEENESKSITVERPEAQAGQSDGEKLPAEKNKSNTFGEVKPSDDSSAAASSISAAPRRFIDVFYGTVETLDGTVSASSQSGLAFCLFPPCSTGKSVSRTVQFRPSAVYGIRVGRWFENYPYVGFAGDLSYLQANAPGVRIWYVPLSIVLMGRYPLFRTGSVPDGRLRLYGGAMMSTVMGDMEIDFTPDMSSKIGGFSGKLISGPGILLGIAWHFPSYALFSEYRMMKLSLDFEQKGLFGGSTSASAELESRQVVFGASYKY